MCRVFSRFARARCVHVAFWQWNYTLVYVFLKSISQEQQILIDESSVVDDLNSIKMYLVRWEINDECCALGCGRVPLPFDANKKYIKPQQTCCPIRNWRHDSCWRCIAASTCVYQPLMRIRWSNMVTMNTNRVVSFSVCFTISPITSTVGRNDVIARTTSEDN